MNSKTLFLLIGLIFFGFQQKGHAQAATNDLYVYYNGYSADDILYIKIVQSSRIQSRPLRYVNGRRVAHFNLTEEGGTYQIMKDICSSKSDCLPNYRTLRRVILRAHQDKTIRL